MHVCKQRRCMRGYASTPFSHRGRIQSTVAHRAWICLILGEPTQFSPAWLARAIALALSAHRQPCSSQREGGRRNIDAGALLSSARLAWPTFGQITGFPLGLAPLPRQLPASWRRRAGWKAGGQAGQGAACVRVTVSASRPVSHAIVLASRR